MIAQARHLLASNSRPFTRALTASSERLEQIPVEIRAALDPWRCPSQLLGWLAHTLSLPVWDDEWTEHQKRSAIARSIWLNRVQGTVAAAKAYPALVGGETLKIIRPPQAFYAGPSETPSERQAWLDTLPQVRVYFERAPRMAGAGIFAGGPGRPAFLTKHYALANDAGLRAGKRAVVIRDGVETEVGFRADVSNQRYLVFLRAPKRAGVFAGRHAGQFALASTAHKRIIAISTNRFQGFSNWTPVRAGGNAVATEPVLGSERGVIGRATHARMRLHRRYAIPSTAHLRLYEYFRFIDDQVPAAQAKRSLSFASVTRLSVPPHTAELQVGIPGRSSRYRLYATQAFAGFFAVPMDLSLRDKVFAALRASRRRTDTLLIDTSTYRPLIAGDRFFAGQRHIAGEWTRT